MLQEILMVAYLVIALLLIGLVLIQQGKGADMGASLGGGGANSVFGSSGSGNFLSKSTTYLAILFFALCLALGNITAGQSKQKDEWEEISVPVSNDLPIVNESVSQQPAAADVPVMTAEEENTKEQD